MINKSFSNAQHGELDLSCDNIESQSFVSQPFDSKSRQQHSKASSKLFVIEDQDLLF